MKCVIFFAAIISLGFVTALKAQTLNAGIMGEYATSSVKISDINSESINTIEGEGLRNFSAGIFAKLKLSPFHFKPELLYSFQKGNVTVTENDGSISQASFAADKLVFPLMFGVKIIGPLHFEAGPVYNYLFYSTGNFNGNIVRINPSGWGYRVGATAEAGRITVGLSYQGIRNEETGISNLATYRSPNQIIIGLGISFGKEK